MAKPSCIAPVLVNGEITDAAIDDLIHRMRPGDVFEAEEFGVSPGENVHAIARHSTYAVMVTHRGRPAFMFGFIQTLPGVFSIWGYGTDHTSKVAKQVAASAKYHARKLFEHHDARRLQVSIPIAPQTQKNVDWLYDSFGLYIESVAKFATVSGYPLATFAYTIDEYTALRSHEDFVSAQLAELHNVQSEGAQGAEAERYRG